MAMITILDEYAKTLKVRRHRSPRGRLDDPERRAHVGDREDGGRDPRTGGKGARPAEILPEAEWLARLASAYEQVGAA